MPLNPRLLDELTLANERFRDGNADSTSLGHTALEAMQGFETDALISPDILFGHPELNTAFEDVINDTALLFNRAGIQTPSFRDIIDSDINFEALESGWITLDMLDQQPQLVLAKDGLTIEEAQNVYAALREAQLAQRQDTIGLYLSLAVKATWEHYMLTILHARIPRVTTPEGDKWTLRIIPGINTTQSMGADYYGRKADTDKQVDIAHPSIGEYITLQARRLQAGELTVNGSDEGVTWLQGGPGAIAVPLGVEGPSSGIVTVGCERVDVRKPYFGARPAVW